MTLYFSSIYLLNFLLFWLLMKTFRPNQDLNFRLDQYFLNVLAFLVYLIYILQLDSIEYKRFKI